MRISQLLSYLLLFLALLAVLACVTTPPPTAERKPTPTPTIAATATLAPPATSLPTSTESPATASTTGTAGTPTQALTPTATALPTPQPDEAIASLEWVEDGISPSEVALVEQLVAASETSQRYFQALINSPWVRNKKGSYVWGEAIGTFNQLAAADENAALRMMDLELAETFDNSDAAAIDFLLSMVVSDPEALNRLLANTTVEESARDGADGFLPVLYLDMHQPEAASMVRAQPWVRDGLANEDLPFVVELEEMAMQSPQAFRALLREISEWLPTDQGADALSEPLKLISSIASVDQEAALRIIDLSYLNRLDARLPRARGPGGAGKVQPTATAGGDVILRGDLRRWGVL